jgi:hypothetical protein
LREGLEHGIFRPKMRVLVDMSEFVGIVDWVAVFAMGGMIPPDNSTTGCLSRIAYVVRDNAWTLSSSLPAYCLIAPTTGPSTTAPTR